jgi:anti-sigma factor RsiW
VSLISDELLMAYADGELDSTESINVETCLQQSPDMAARLAVFASTGRGLANIFDRPMLEPVPQRLVDAIYAPVSYAPVSVAAQSVAAQVGGPAIGSAYENVIPFAAGRRQARATSRPAFQQHLSLAAACVTLLAVGAGSYWLFNKPAGQPSESFALAQSSSGAWIASAELASVLDTVLGDKTAVAVIAGKEATIKPLFTFATADKNFCRQYEITRGQAQAIAGVACRGSEGQWRVETHVAFDKALAKTGETGTADITPAGKDGVATVETTVTRLKAGEVLDNGQVAALMKQGWKATAP